VADDLAEAEFGCVLLGHTIKLRHPA